MAVNYGEIQYHAHWILIYFGGAPLGEGVSLDCSSFFNSFNHPLVFEAFPSASLSVSS